MAGCWSTSFRGAPTFPAMFAGTTGDLMASHLPGFAFTPAVAVGMGAVVASVLQLPLSAVVLATLLTVKGGTGDEPLIIVGVVVAYLVTPLNSRATSREPASAHDGAASPPALHEDGSTRADSESSALARQGSGGAGSAT